MSYLIDLLFPRTCFSCKKVGQYLCCDCRSKLVYKGTKPGDRLSLFRYHGAIKKLITTLKFNFVSDIVPEMSEIISSAIITRYPNLLQYWHSHNFVLVPIPLHSLRHNWRGFNQSELICQHLSKLLNLKYAPDLLVRIKNSSPQSSIKDRRLRKVNTNLSFKLMNSNNQNIILFDDVYTTGSTITSAKSVFPESFEVWTLTIAG